MSRPPYPAKERRVDIPVRHVTGWKTRPPLVVHGLDSRRIGRGFSPLEGEGRVGCCSKSLQAALRYKKRGYTDQRHWATGPPDALPTKLLILFFPSCHILPVLKRPM